MGLDLHLGRVGWERPLYNVRFDFYRLATVCIGLASFYMVYDFPDEATFLSSVDRQRVLRRLKADKQSSAEHESFKMAYFWASIKDLKTWVFAATYMGCRWPLSCRYIQ